MVFFKNDGEVSYFNIWKEVGSHYHEIIASGLGQISVVVACSFSLLLLLLRKTEQGKLRFLRPQTWVVIWPIPAVFQINNALFLSLTSRPWDRLICLSCLPQTSIRPVPTPFLRLNIDIISFEELSLTTAHPISPECKTFQRCWFRSVYHLLV